MKVESQPTWTREFLVTTAALYRQLPPDGRWTQRRRDQWLKAMTAAVDLHFDVDDSPAPSLKAGGA